VVRFGQNPLLVRERRFLLSYPSIPKRNVKEKLWQSAF
jgi:hypothetical protein